MLNIYPIQKTFTGNSVKLSVRFTLFGREDFLSYSFDKRLDPYLVIEQLDAFVVALLLLGLKTGSDIHLNGTLSARLNYTLNHYLIPALCLSNPNYHRIKVSADKLNNKSMNTCNEVGSGLSCGVDSLASYFLHKDEYPPYRISQFTFFNAGSNGDYGGQQAERVFKTRAKFNAAFAKEVGLGFITVDSNISEILQMNFQQSHTLRNISCVLHLQKYFTTYYYASSYRLDHIKLNSKDTSDFDFIILNMLSTESTTFFSAGSQFTRVEKTLMISDFPVTYQFLDVCINPSESGLYVNCSICDKCMRTQLTLDLADKLKHYKAVFDLDKYNKNKNNYVGRLLIKRNKSGVDYELIHYLERKNCLPFTRKIKYFMQQMPPYIKRRSKSGLSKIRKFILRR